jgi:hypothetical protein
MGSPENYLKLSYFEKLEIMSINSIYLKKFIDDSFDIVETDYTHGKIINGQSTAYIVTHSKLIYYENISNLICLQKK